MMLPVLTHHIRYHQCLMHLDKLIGYVFNERCLLQVSHSYDSCLLTKGLWLLIDSESQIKKKNLSLLGLLVRFRRCLPHYCAHSSSLKIVQVETWAEELAKVTNMLGLSHCSDSGEDNNSLPGNPSPPLSGTQPQALFSQTNPHSCLKQYRRAVITWYIRDWRVVAYSQLKRGRMQEDLPISISDWPFWHSYNDTRWYCKCWKGKRQQATSLSLRWRRF